MEQMQCLNTEPGSSKHGEGIIRVIMLEGNEVIREASELTKSKSNVICGEPDDFTKTLLAYESKRQ
jgi:hypothetical protein